MQGPSLEFDQPSTRSAGALEAELQQRRFWAAASSLLIMGLFLLHLGMKVAFHSAFAYGELPAVASELPMDDAMALDHQASVPESAAFQPIPTALDASDRNTLAGQTAAFAPKQEAGQDHLLGHEALALAQ